MKRSTGFDEFLKEAAPLLGLHWRPFKRKGVKRKIERRMIEVGLSDFDEYLWMVQKDPEEQNRFSKILAITISRFFRDKEVFRILEDFIIPRVVQNIADEGAFKIWSIGCASGEEPYSFLLLWKERFEKSFPKIHLSILATDIDENMLKRAKEGRYRKSSLKEVPEKVLQGYFKMEDGGYVLDRSIRQNVDFRRHDIIREEPFSGMDIIFCRNLAFTYFSKPWQMNTLIKIASSLKAKGYILIGKDEILPLTYPALFVPAYPKEKIYQKFLNP